MPSSFDVVSHEALRLEPRERATLAHRLLLSLEGEEEADVETAWEEEVGRRMDEIRRGSAQGRAADSVFSDIRARYGR